MKHYWFKPKQFWKWFAAYYPVSWQGWLVTLVLAGALVAAVSCNSYNSSSIGETLISASPWIVVVLLTFDLVTVRTGEYPSWWKRRTHK